MAIELPETAVSRRVDSVLAGIGRVSVWIWLVLLVVIVFNVALRYLFGEGRIELEELQWHLNAVGFLIAVVYGYQADSHIRIDVVSARLRPRLQVWIEFYGILLLVLPFVVMVIWFSLPFVQQSFAVSEVSQSPGGLPYRWLLKGAIPVAFVLLGCAAVSRLTRVWTFLRASAS